MEGKKVSQQGIIGQLGANLIERVVLEMGYIWRPTPIFDVGIDGEIEIRDPATGIAKSTSIRVQAKATSLPFQAETAEAFEYTCDEKELQYWLLGNVAVILIVCRPKTQEAYWVPVREYFKDLAARKSRKIRFEKARDRFDGTAAARLRALALPKDSGLYFAPLAKIERLYTNLLQVVSYGPKIYIAETDYRKETDLWRDFKSKGERPGPEWILSEKRIVSFQNLEEAPFNSICDLGTLETFDACEWADAQDAEHQYQFVRLLNISLRERARLLGLHYYQDESLKYYYFPATRGLKKRKSRYHSLKLNVGREVFKQYNKKSDSSQPAYCRHSAFKGNFVRANDQWYLEITPTYHFTVDGYRVDPFREGRLAKIKRLERNPAVLGQLLMWVSLLQKPLASLFVGEYPYLSFGKLAVVELEAGIPDDIWYEAEEGEDATALGDPVNQPRLFDL